MVFVQRSLAGPDGDSGILAVSEQVFAIAARRLSPTEILENLHKWIQENKLSFRIKAVDSANTPLGQIVDAILRYRALIDSEAALAEPTEQWLRVSLTHAEWAAIEAAAARQPRAPWLDNRSRVLPTWAGILEAGVEHDDHRFRRAAYVRVGYGIGHEHQDSLDLQVAAHGLPMTIDGGQRRGYTIPTDSAGFVHNTVLVDSAEAYRHSWIRALADHAGARYLEAAAAPPSGVQLFRRQVALVDVDEGQGSQRLSVAQQMLDAELPKDVTTANSYVFDVFRVGGGRQLTYGFHLFTDEFLREPPELPPGKIDSMVWDRARVPGDLPAGTYTLSIAVVEPGSVKPAVQPGIKGRAADGWYPLSSLTVPAIQDSTGTLH